MASNQSNLRWNSSVEKKLSITLLILSFFWHQCFDYPNYVRIVLTVPAAQLQEACMRMAHFCEAHYVGEGHKGHHAVDDRSLPVGRIHDKTRLPVPAIEPWARWSSFSIVVVVVESNANIIVFSMKTIFSLKKKERKMKKSNALYNCRDHQSKFELIRQK